MAINESREDAASHRINHRGLTWNRHPITSTWSGNALAFNDQTSHQGITTTTIDERPVCDYQGHRHSSSSSFSSMRTCCLSYNLLPFPVLCARSRSEVAPTRPSVVIVGGTSR